MNYFHPYPLPPDRTMGTTVAAWDSQLAEAAATPWLKEVLLRNGSELFPRFATFYAELRALPRSARRSLQRRIGRSSELATIFPEWLQSGGGRALQHKLEHSLAGAALLVALAQGVATADTIAVTTKDPRVGPDGQCSLIEAIVNANADARVFPDCEAGNGPDTIVLPANADVRLSDIYDDIYGPTGLPVITSPITIQGSGAKITRRGGRRFRFLAVSNSGDLTLQNVTLSKGGSGDHDGGAASNYGTLTIENSTISGNIAASGGALSNVGTLTIRYSTLSRNTASAGGGVSNFQSGTVTIENSTISDNRANAGGGVFNFGSALGIANSTISGNKVAFSGGGMFNLGRVLNVASSTVSNNSARWGGGAFNISSYSALPSTLSIVDSTISGNKASDDGGGIFNAGGFDYYGYHYPAAYLSLVGSTISKNQAKDAGGGLFNEGSLDTTNSTISGNRARFGPDIFP